jgi:hypothetical protein
MPEASRMIPEPSDSLTWLESEADIAELMPEGLSPNRQLLLLGLRSYATQLVRQARRLGAIVPTAPERARALAWLDHPVFICGHHRTGTTLLRNLLDGHPDVVVLPSEGTYLSSFPYAVRGNVSQDGIDRFTAEWINRLVDPNAGPHFLLGRSTPDANPYLVFARRLLGWHGAIVEQWPDRAPFALLLALVAAFADGALEGHQARGWIEKTPLNEVHAALWTRAFPRARFIQLVREPAATMASVIEIYRAGGIKGDRSLRYAWSIGRSFRLARENRERFPSRYLVVRYEDLSGAPVKELDLVRNFLALPPHPGLMQPTVLGRPVAPNSSFKEGAPGVIAPPRGKAPLEGRVQDLVDTLISPAATTFGYGAAPVAPLNRATLLLRETSRYAVARLSEKWRSRPWQRNGA